MGANGARSIRRERLQAAALAFADAIASALDDEDEAHEQPIRRRRPTPRAPLAPVTDIQRERGRKALARAGVPTE